jgi:hypothetical protein
MRHRRTIFHAQVGPVWIPQKGHRDKLRRTCILHLVGSVGNVVHSGVSAEQNITTLFFLLGWERYGFHQKCVGTSYAKRVFLHPVGSVGHVVHSGASRERNIDALFFMFGWERYGFHEKCVGTRYVEFAYFCIRWDLRATYCVPVRPRSETSTHYFSCSGGTGTYSTKSAPGHVTPNLCFCIRWDLRIM